MSEREVAVGNLSIGGSAPVRVESMLKSPLEEYDTCLKEIQLLHEEGCELARVAFPSEQDVSQLKRLCRTSPIPLMADIHFSAKLAVLALEAGCPAIRINPGNLPPGEIRWISETAQDRGAVIRIGANSGSLSTRHLEQGDGDRGTALACAVGEQVGLLEDCGFDNMIISAKSTSIPETVRANQLLASRYSYPLHIGITEAGTGMTGTVKSSAGLALLLSQGIGDTLRVSLTGPSSEEPRVGFALLSALEIRQHGAELISCPTCGRKKMDVFGVAKSIEPHLARFPSGIKIAVMGCEVNGPREAMEADIGVAGAREGMVLFKHGRFVRHLPPMEIDAVVRILLEEAQRGQR